MADTISLPGDVTANEPVTWKPVRDLADAISKLYADKKIFELTETDAGLTTSKSTRVTDVLANTCVDDSSKDGCVYLTKDVTAPFRLDKLGEEGNLAPKCLAFEFAYDVDSYKDYLNGTKLPVLTTQYLIYYELLTDDQFSANEGHVSITTDDIVAELSSQANTRDEITVSNLIESHRHEIKKFWKRKSDSSQEAETYADDPTIAGELYLKIKTPGGGDCTSVTRVAFAGLNTNGNGNSGNTPTYSHVEGHVGDTYYFLKEGASGWNGSNLPIAITLTGVTMDREYGPGQAVSEEGFKPEGDANAKGYTPPPIGCCGLCSWPTIGAEGGGGTNTFFNPGLLDNYINWADWRGQYQKELTNAEAAESAVSSTDEIPAGRFPCQMGMGAPANIGTSYAHRTKIKNTTYFQSWINVSDNTYVRIAPLEFNGSDGKKAYLAVPLTIAVILEPISYQTAIRKRWYDMMYYTLRNITGYKLTSNEGSAETHKIIGVTWNTDKIDPASFIRKCENSSDKCTCDTMSYERWKILELGGETSDQKFVGTAADFSKPNTEAAQMWQWEVARYSDITSSTNDLNVDTLFPELYFERLLCYKNADTYAAEPGGFENPEKQSRLCDCYLCKYSETDLILPWDGGGNNQPCDDDASVEKTHAYTFNTLKKLTQFVIDNKLPEDAPRPIEKLELGYSYCPATIGDTATDGITFSNVAVTYYAGKIVETELETYYSAECVSKTVNIKLPKIPSYYNTLSKNEKYANNKNGSDCVIEIQKDEKAFGYNAYIWKAIDLGGYDNSGNITVEFTCYNPARICGSGTIIKANSIDIEDNAIDDLLWLNNTNCYPLKPDTYIACNCGEYAEYCPNKEGSIKAYEHNSDPCVWKETMYWCGNSDSVTDCRLNESPATRIGNAVMWHRDNSDKSIGTLDVYVAPFWTSGTDHKNKVKCIGSYTFKRETPTKDIDIEEWPPQFEQALFYYCCDEGPIYGELPAEQQRYSESDGAIAVLSNTTDMLEVQIDTQPSATSYDESDFLKATITIPIDSLVETTSSENKDVKTDMRQKYIIIAARSSHTHISSLLSQNSTVSISNNPSDEKTTWAMHYAGACRYDKFKTEYKFSQKS